MESYHPDEVDQDQAVVSRELPPSWLYQLREDVSLSWADIPILACSFVSGLIDCVAFSAASVFVSMQTGNTIFLALGASNLPAGQPLNWLRALVSLAAFWLGCVFFANARRFHPHSKTTLSLSFLIQAVLIFVSAALGQARVAPAFASSQLDPHATNAHNEGEEDGVVVFIVIALLAFQASGQIVLSRTLGFNEIPTNVVTSLYCDLLSDQKLFAPLNENVKRNRRVAAAILLLVGGIVGGWLQRSRAGMPGALWIAGFVKLVIAFSWLGWNSRKDAATQRMTKA